MKKAYFCLALSIPCIIFIGTISCSTSLRHLNEKYSQEEIFLKNMIKSVRHIVRTHSETNFPHYCALFFSPPGENHMDMMNVLRLTQNTLFIINTWPNSEENLMIVKNHRNCSMCENIIVFTAISDIHKIISNVNVTCTGGRIKLIMAIHDVLQSENEAKKLAKIVVDFAWKQHKCYSIVLVPVDGRILVFKSGRHKRMVRCEPEEPRMISYWENGTLMNGNSMESSSFDLRFNNNKCVVRVATANCGFLSRVVNETGHETAAGIEGRMLEAIAKNQNYTMELISVVPQRNELFGIPASEIIYTNGTRTREKLESGEADIGACSLWISYREDMKYTHSYSGNCVVLMIPIPKYIPFDSVLHTFSESVWICILVSLMLGRIMIRINRKSISFFMTLALFLGESVHSNSPISFVEKGQITLWVIYGYLITQSYISSLASVLNNPNMKEIETIEDLEISDIRVAGFPLQRERFKVDNKYKRIVETFVNVEEGRYMEMMKNPDKVLANPNDTAILVDVLSVKGHAWVSRYYQLKETISNLPFGMGVMSQRRISLNELDRTITSLVESGLVIKWTDDDSIIPESKLSSDIQQPSPVLSLDEVAGIFLILVIGLSLSIIVFVFEVCKTRRTSENKTCKEISRIEL